MKNAKDFKSKAEFLKYLVANKAELIDFKKSAVKFTDPLSVTDNNNTIKELSTNHKDDVQSGVIKRTVIGNTYNWMDSVNDVLLDGVFQKSINERTDKIWHLHDHEYKITAKIGKPVSIYEKRIAWTELGINKIGMTTALFMDSNIMKDYNPLLFGMYLNKEINQHSVGMQYVKIDLAVNDPEMKAEFAVWSKYIDQIGNKEKVLEDGYFWAVSEGKLHEISAVLAGANELTPTLDNKENSEADEINLKIKINVEVNEEAKHAYFLTPDFVSKFSLK